MPVGRPGLLAERQLVASSTLSDKPKSGEACDRGVFIYDLEVVTPVETEPSVAFEPRGA